MPDSHTTEVAHKYLAELKSALTGVPAEVGDAILGEVAEELEGLSAADAATRIRALGDPQFIAAEARDQSPSAPPAAPPAASPKAQESSRRAPWFEIVAAVLVMVGGMVIPVVGAVAGVVMVWFSRVWTRRQKWIATLVPLAIVAVTVAVAIAVSGYIVNGSQGSGGEPVNPLLPGGVDFIAFGLLVAIVGQLAVGTWLLISLRRHHVRDAQRLVTV
ncbi:hypothetical protein ESZ53_08525 [Salinibacterium sp. UTAS2018]|uniref:HAAS signaling domain-containing protein n=1 Tax=Salinibacterium sp. UTAS2018 TaxID=2508880 RepID=UPI0010095BA7|nr:hypothetical protein [Salinibacterium sp. UTAS2018]QAV70480.1 hypothetical protein ESZ53_08525 [Salinibacterium sp. UTAS2018]